MDKKPMTDRALPLLEEGLSKLSLAGENKTFPLLLRYMEEIELFNGAYGLVKVRDRRELVVKHILDSLAPISILQRALGKRLPSDESGNPLRIADVGSGAGLPGIPLAICMPNAEFTLIERMGRRAGFLRNTLAILGLPNVRLEETEMEIHARAPSGMNAFDVVVFRAFKPLEQTLLRDLFKLLAPGGFLAAYKGRKESVEEEMAALSLPSETIPPEVIPWEVYPVEVPFLEEERHLLVIRPRVSP